MLLFREGFFFGCNPKPPSCLYVLRSEASNRRFLLQLSRHVNPKSPSWIGKVSSPTVTLSAMLDYFPFGWTLTLFCFYFLQSLLLRKKKKFLGCCCWIRTCKSRRELELVTRYLPTCATPRWADRGGQLVLGVSWNNRVFGNLSTYSYLTFCITRKVIRLQGPKPLSYGYPPSQFTTSRVGA